jgi:hypothetical protein
MHKFLLIKHPDEITEQLQDLTEHNREDHHINSVNIIA